MVRLTEQQFRPYQTRQSCLRSLDDRNRLVEENYFLVHALAADLNASTSANIEYDDLVSMGVMGLIESANAFDPSRNVSFRIYCRHRVKGAMLDQLRQQDWVPRLTRQRKNRLKRAETTLESQLDRKPYEEELAVEMEVDKTEFNKIKRDSSPVSMVSLDSITGFDQEGQWTGMLEDSKAYDPIGELQEQDARKFLTKNLNKLEKTIVSLYYYEDLTMRRIGKILGISESRVSQVHTDIISRLRDRITMNRERFILAL